VRELQTEMREMSSQVSTIRGMGMGFGFIVILLQIVQFMTDRRLKFRESDGE
jgi:Na+-transporting methylmalonyl-CoA/oxaloacetate decarboxylase gamma subunit